MNNTLSWITENFNNREIAAATWTFMVLTPLFFKKNIRKSFANVAAAIINHKILILFISLAIWVVLLALLGNKTGLWEPDQSTATTVWYFFAGLPLLSRSFNAKEGSQHFRGYAIDALSGTAILEFIYVAKTFSLPIELILTPTVGLIATMAIIAERDPEHSAVQKLMIWLLVIFSLGIFWNSVNQIWAEPGEFFSTETFKNFLLPIYLTLGSIPFFYALHCYSAIELARIQIDRKTFQTDDLKRYAKKRFFLVFIARPWLLRRATRQFHIKPAMENKDVEQIILDILQYEREEESPPIVDPQDGWSPYEAREFLADEALRTSDYHEGTDGEEWWSGVATCELDDGIHPPIGSYSFCGPRGIVQQLKLRGHFVDGYVTSEALDEFSRLSIKLAQKALGDEHTQVLASLTNRHLFEMEIGETRIRLVQEKFPNDKGFELTVFLNR